MWSSRTSPHFRGMPVRYRILKDLGLIHTTWEGVVTLGDAMEHNAQLTADPAFDPDMLQFSDASRAEISVSAPGVRSLAKQSPWGPRSRRAFLVSDRASYGISRMYTSQEQRSGAVRIFQDCKDALHWLGIDPSVLSDET